MNAGDTYRREAGAHLWVVISDPRIDQHSVLVVNVTSMRGKHWGDTTCVLQPGDHPFIKRPSLLLYAAARLHANAALDRELSAGRIQLQEPVSAEVLTRIREGAMQSPNMRFGYQELLKQQGLVGWD